MKINLKLSYKNYVFRWLILPIVILFSSIFFLFCNLLLLDFSPLTISYNHSFVKDSQSSVKNIDNGTELVGSLVAQENQLGILSLNFSQERPVKGKFIFELFDNNGKLISENSYDTREFYYLQNYPFGFPIQVDSKGKTYFFKIKYYADNNYASEAVHIQESFILTKYHFQLDESKLIKSFLDFIYKKFEYSFFINEYFKYFIFYSLPLLVILFLNLLYELGLFSEDRFSGIKKQLSKYYSGFPNQYPYFLFFYLSYVIFIPIFSTIADLAIGAYWIFLLIKNNLSAKYTFIHLFHNFILMVPLYIIYVEDIMEKNTILTFIFLTIFCVQSLIEYVRYEKK